MTKQADLGSKRLISLDLQGWVEWITQKPQVQAQEMIGSGFEWVGREGDVLIRAWDPQVGHFLIANEIQLRYTPKVPRRIRAYAALAEEKYELPVFPILIVILPAPDTEIPTVYQSRLFELAAYQDYKVIQLSQVEANLVFSQPLPTLLPFVPIMKGGGNEETIKRALSALQQDPTLAELESLLAFFASFVLETEVVAEIMRWDMTVLRESPWYQEIEQRGIEIGEQRGIEIGEQRGILETVIETLAVRFQSVPEDLVAQFQAMTVDQLRPLHRQALVCPDLETFRQSLE